MSPEFLALFHGDTGVGDREPLNGRGPDLASGNAPKEESLNRAVRLALDYPRALMIADATPKAKCKLSANGSTPMT
jgi:hypothetical protein